MSHTHLTLEERVSIEIFVSMGMSCREMAAGPATTAPFPASCVAAAPDPVTVPGLLPAGLEKDKRRRTMAAA